MKILPSVFITIVLFIGSASAQQQISASDTFEVVEACLRLTKASIAYQEHLDRIESQRNLGRQGNEGYDTFEDFTEIPTVKLLADIVDLHSNQTGLRSEDCMKLRTDLSVLDALQR
jgi:hypothetical protein